jgi:hypothetical protein
MPLPRPGGVLPEILYKRAQEPSGGLQGSFRPQNLVNFFQSKLQSQSPPPGPAALLGMERAPHFRAQDGDEVYRTRFTKPPMVAPPPQIHPRPPLGRGWRPKSVSGTCDGMVGFPPNHA